MAVIDFNFNEANESKAMLNAAAKALEEESGKMNSVIERIRAGWQGTGSEQYIEYLQGLTKDIIARTAEMNRIALSMQESISKAEEADREAIRKLREAAGAGAVSASGTSPPQVCPPPDNDSQVHISSSGQSHSGGGQSFDSPNLSEAAEYVDNMFGNAAEAIRNAMLRSSGK